MESDSNLITQNISIEMNAEIAEIELTFNNNNFTFNTQAKAGGKYIFSGKSNNSSLTARYTSQIDAQNLEVKNLTVTNGTIQDFYVQASDTLVASTTKTGRIFYKGNPSFIDSLKCGGLLLKLK